MEPLNYIIATNYAEYCAIKIYLQENDIDVLNLVDPLVKQDIEANCFYFVYDSKQNKVRCIYDYQLNICYNYPVVTPFSFNQLQCFAAKIKEKIKEKTKTHFDDLESDEFFVTINDPMVLRIKKGKDHFTILDAKDYGRKSYTCTGNFLHANDVCWGRKHLYVKRVRNVRINTSFEIDNG